MHCRLFMLKMIHLDCLTVPPMSNFTVTNHPTLIRQYHLFHLFTHTIHTTPYQVYTVTIRTSHITMRQAQMNTVIVDLAIIILYMEDLEVVTIGENKKSMGIFFIPRVGLVALIRTQAPNTMIGCQVLRFLIQ
jgi:hypothetical protein